MNISFRLLLIILFFILLSGRALYSEEAAQEQMKRPQAALIKSAIVPGWGELSVGNKSGYVFLLSELLFWSGRFYFLEESRVLKKEAYLFALKHSGISPDKYDQAVIELISKYNSSGFQPGGYNESILRQAKTLYPDDLDKQDQYLKDNMIFEESLFWEWESKDHKRRYNIIRKNSNHNTDYAKAVMGAIVANHLLSALNAARVTSLNNKKNGLEFSIDLEKERLQPILTATYRF